MGRMLVVAYTAICLLANLVHSFTTQSPAARTIYFALRVIDNEDDGIVGDETIPDFGEGDLQVAGVTIDDLSWRVERLRLEEQNRRRFLKARPRFLPYDECRKWVQAFNRWSSEKEWKSWISMGEKRNSYIPSRPDEYYNYTGDWISWDHFLGVQSNGGTDVEHEDSDTV